MSTYESVVEMKALLAERPFEVLALAFKGHAVALATLAPNGVYAESIRMRTDAHGEFFLPGTAEAMEAYKKGIASFKVWTETEGGQVYLDHRPHQGGVYPLRTGSKILSRVDVESH